VRSNSIQESVDRLLVQAGDAVIRMDWPAVRSYASAALSFDPDSGDAKSYLSAAQQNLSGSADLQLLLNPARVIVLSVLSAGLYLYYWAYLTWKQLKPETGDDHYPVWHALSLLVPVYGLFRIHNQLEVIEEMASRAGGPSLNPSVGVLLLIAANITSWVASFVMDVSTGLVLASLSTSLYAITVWRAQVGLNSAWRERYSGAVARPISWVEIAFALVGVLLWVGAVFPAE